MTAADVREAAMTLFAATGYHGTSLKDVAAAVRLRIPSLYHHIESKPALLEDIVMSTLLEVHAEFEKALAQSSRPVEQLRGSTYVYALHHARHRREALIVNQDAKHLPEPARSAADDLRRGHEHRFRDVIEEGRRGGDFDVESAKLASFAIREMCVSIARWYKPDGGLSEVEVARQYTTHAMRIVGAVA